MSIYGYPVVASGKVAEKRIQSYLLPLRFLPEEKERLERSAEIDKSEGVTVWARNVIRQKMEELLEEEFSVIQHKKQNKLKAAAKKAAKPAKNKTKAKP